MSHILLVLFRWPDGIVLGNLIASAIWAIPGFVHLDRLARRHHRERLAAIRRAGHPLASPQPAAPESDPAQP